MQKMQGFQDFWQNYYIYLNYARLLTQLTDKDSTYFSDYPVMKIKGSCMLINGACGACSLSLP